jgi:HK97 gp10 family phage protein
MSLDLTLVGFEDALERVRKLWGGVHDNISGNAHAALEPVAEEARRLAPVDSGQYRDSIVVSTRLAGEPERGRGGAVFVGPLFSNVFYAWYLEFGTVNMRAQPVLIPAVEANQALVFEVLGQRVGQDILAASI